ncbi:DNA-binding response regulator [Sphingorhabdus lutea]|uniref:DNA-binding response regulator n=1 Tax=Sphingorhabdus lutea TaxID=1913578 RepID=A0A1L3JAL7_9SPHN|nr:LytTR family DNA-binding domain-containing protein [Sphingorhabdus lutea]APG62175.1 DNA-binding response regulator [Sphingorhabdus lutea]
MLLNKDIIRLIIVDDEPLAVERLELLCRDIKELEIVGTANDGEEALEKIKALEPDLILMDIAMPRMTGIEAARSIAMLPKKPKIIFITAFDNFALEAFDLDVVDYVLKPVAPERLGRAISRAAESIGEDNDSPSPSNDKYTQEFWVSHRSELIRVAADDIRRIEAERDYMRLFTGERSYLLHQTISSLEERLNPAAFQRIHRSHIIRTDNIRGLRHEGGGVWFALLNNDESIRIGRKYLADVKKLAGK